jgi:hypothetical protein
MSEEVVVYTKSNIALDHMLRVVSATTGAAVTEVFPSELSENTLLANAILDGVELIVREMEPGHPGMDWTSLEAFPQFEGARAISVRLRPHQAPTKAIVAEMVKICGGLVSLPSGLDLLAEDFLRLLQRDPDVDLMTVEKVPDAG